MSQANQFNKAMKKFDAASAEDPHLVPFGDGTLAAELVYAQHMTRWLERLYPDASEALQLAARAQHAGRWKTPRDIFPMTRAGYYKWRTTLYAYHADTAAEILRSVGYDDHTIQRVQTMLRKENLKTDPEVQALEDVACMVFLENYLQDFAAGHDEAKVIQILRRTWGKMSPHAQAATGGLEMSPPAKALLDKALTPDP